MRHSESRGAQRSDDERRERESAPPAEPAADVDAIEETKPSEPDLPEDVVYSELDRDTRAGLRSLPKGLAEVVGLRLVAAGRLIDNDPELALEHAMVARRLASRIAVVREAVGVTAYLVGQWQTAIGELRTAQRLSGTRSHVAMIADAERALGRPERAVDAFREYGADGGIEPEVRIELLIVAAGARRDMGQGPAAVAMLQVPELNASGNPAWLSRLRFAYADALYAEKRYADAREWFERVLEIDPEDEHGVGERLLELDGVTWVEDPVDLGGEADALDEPAAETEAEDSDGPAAAQREDSTR